MCRYNSREKFRRENKLFPISCSFREVQSIEMAGKIGLYFYKRWANIRCQHGNIKHRGGYVLGSQGKKKFGRSLGFDGQKKINGKFFRLWSLLKWRWR